MTIAADADLTDAVHATTEKTGTTRRHAEITQARRWPGKGGGKESAEPRNPGPALSGTHACLRDRTDEVAMSQILPAERRKPLVFLTHSQPPGPSKMACLPIQLLHLAGYVPL